MTKAKLIQLIHIASQQLKLDDDTYREMLRSNSGKTSTRDMDVMQLGRVLDSMKRRGWKPKPPRKARAAPTPPVADFPQAGKIRALWLEMHDQGIVHDRTEAALQAFIRKMTAVDRLQWLTPEQASGVIEMLKQWQKRALNGGKHGNRNAR
ncbi:gp16 family protein [Serratia marcescens]|uniref:gp16 family protein n=1 Tax=Serratia marcescens TaxID=615 RepID=UPI0037D0EC7E